ncbi:MAG: hypothetical protein HWD85_04750 [Flavobacteriaceae bacterium]|nr:hypothetical protein [Flavobacteriaceae bacterium]
MNFHKLISVILHPIVIPTIGVILFLSISPLEVRKERQYLLISIVFFATYIIPLISLIILKALGYINSFQVTTIKERKTPIYLMLLIFYVLGKLLYNIVAFKELGILFFGTITALVIVYFLFFLKIKTSLHVLSLSSMLGFFLLYATLHSISILPIAIVLVLLTGILASARLHLKAHTPKEIYIGFFLGFTSQFITFLFL